METHARRITARTTLARFRVRHHDPAFNLRDAEVAAQMGKIDWADRPTHHKKIDLTRFGNQNRDVTDGIILQANP